MDPQILGQIQQFGFNFAPRGWAFCNGQLLSISQNTALFSLLGTIYGGDGRTTFGLPNLQGRVSFGFGRGPGLSDHRQGSKGGSEQVTLTIAQIPSHNHIENLVAEAPNVPKSEGALLATPNPSIYSTSAADEGLNNASITNTGGGQSHNNMQPYLSLNWCIALTGTYPSRS